MKKGAGTVCSEVRHSMQGTARLPKVREVALFNLDVADRSEPNGRKEKDKQQETGSTPTVNIGIVRQRMSY